jgi:hypothetical protein
MVDQKPKEQMTNKQFTQVEKAKRGWWFSVFFMILVVCLIVFLSFVEIKESNRDIIIGMVGMLTGAISSMLSIAAGRDPSEIEELKDKLSSANADRQALISRLRDAQINVELYRNQIFELQTAMIDKLSIFKGENVVRTKSEEDVILNKHVEEWLPSTDRNKKL